MTATGDLTCAEKLLQPARLVLRTGRHIRHEPFERRIALWNSVRSGQDRYLREECGNFLEEVDLHLRSQFDAALIALAAAFAANQEEFPAYTVFAPEEVAIWEQIGHFSALELLSQDEMRNRLLRKEESLLNLLRDYYQDMDGYVSRTLDDNTIRLTLRYWLWRRWNGYRGKMNAAIADAVMTLDWMPALVAQWERDRDGTTARGERS